MTITEGHMGVLIAGDRPADRAAVAICAHAQLGGQKWTDKSANMNEDRKTEAVMGKAPQPAALKLLGGRSPGRDSGGRPVPDVPRFERGAPQPPPWLSEQARAVWEATAPTLEALNLIKPEDGLIFTALCESWATYWRRWPGCAPRG